jgi:hypothetical protein
MLRSLSPGEGVGNTKTTVDRIRENPARDKKSSTEKLKIETLPGTRERRDSLLRDDTRFGENTSKAVVMTGENTQEKLSVRLRVNLVKYRLFFSEQNALI